MLMLYNHLQLKQKLARTKSVERTDTTFLIFYKMSNFINRWFCNKNYTPMAQLIVSISFGILLSPWSSGLFFLVTFALIYEILFYIFTKGDPEYYDPFVRVTVNMGYLFGYIVGRTVAGDDILYEGVPCFPWEKKD
jgi:hypothetical protein